jgi:hypothetical protein
MKRVALIAGASIATLMCVAPTKVWAWPGDTDSWWGATKAVSPSVPAPQKSIRTHSRSSERKSGQNDGKADKTPAPTGVLHIIVSIDKQRATLFADGVPFASTAMSSGTASHPTPMGVFTVIQKDRHHVSNLYDASMPYMQRITWSGSALHEGPLPGYPASHGCVRLTTSFAQLLWKATKMGARVVVTRPDVVPVAFEHARLFAPKPKVAFEPAVTSALIKTADAGNAVPVADAHVPIKTIVTEPSANTPAVEQATKLPITDGAGGAEAAPPVEPTEVKSVEAKPAQAKPAVTLAAPAPIIVDERSKTSVAKPAVTSAAPAPVIVDERPKTMPATIVLEANGRPISVFASLKDGKLYVRQGWKPLFEAPVSFVHPEQPVGTHVYTAMGMKAGGNGLRWTVVSIPSSNRRVAELKVADNSRKSRNDRPVKAIEVEPPMPSASAALDRIVMPPELAERISELITPGSSLIVSDNRLSDETGEYTDFIVLTR